MTYKSYTLSSTGKIVKKLKVRPEHIAIFINQHGRLIVIPYGSLKFKDKMDKRPFSLVGVYGPDAQQEWIDEDVKEAMQRHSAAMELRRMMCRKNNKAY